VRRTFYDQRVNSSDDLVSSGEEANDQRPDAAGSQHPVFWVLPVVLAVLLPALWFAAANRPHPLRIDIFVTMTLVVALCAVAILLALRRLGGRSMRWNLGVTAVLVAVGFQWRTLTFIGGEIADVLGLSFVGEFVPVLIGGALVWFAVRLAEETPFILVIGGVILVACFVLGSIDLSLRVPGPTDGPRVASSEGPHTLLIVFDAYGRQDDLADLFETDISGFVEDLEQRGFTVASEATANYPFTYGSVAAMLNLDYTIEAGEITEDELELMRAALTGSVGLLPRFEKAGYETAYIQNAWAGSQCGSGVDWCIRDGLMARTLWNLGRMTIFSPLVEMIWADPFNSLSINQLQDLGDYLVRPTPAGEPRFMFAHFLLPHFPLRLTADCTKIDDGPLAIWGVQPDLLDERRRRYGAQVRCVNRLTLNAIDRYLAAYPDAAIMITGDHGPLTTMNPDGSYADISPAALEERMNIFSAYRFPGCDAAVRPDITPVNGARLLANCVLDAGLAEVPDRNLWIDEDGMGEAIDITSVIVGGGD
jgi:hypothetical protein